MKLIPWTDEDVEKMKDMRKSGKTWEQVATAVNRTAAASMAKYIKTLKEENEPKELPKKKSIQRLIALVGSPDEVTRAMRNLFERDIEL